MPPEPLNVWDFERLAEEKLDPGAYGYFAGGAGDEVTLDENVAAFRRLKLRPRVLVDVSAVTTEADVLGQRVSMPLLVAPMAYQRLAHPEGECATARAAARAGTILPLDDRDGSRVGDRGGCAQGQRWLQLYVFRDRGVTNELLAEAVDANFSAVLLTVTSRARAGVIADLLDRRRYPHHVPRSVRALGHRGRACALRTRSRVSRDAQLGCPEADCGVGGCLRRSRGS